MGDIVDWMTQMGMHDMPDPFDHDEEDVVDYMQRQGWNGPKLRPRLRCQRCGDRDVIWSAYPYKLLDTNTGDEHVCQTTPEGFDDVE